MHRRRLIKAGLSAVAAMPLAHGALGQSASDKTRAKVSICSRHLQWLRGGDEVARACIEMAFDGVDVSVAAAPGHVDPAHVAAELPAFVNAVRGHGLVVETISCPALEADAPELENILASAAALGIKGWSREPYRYDAARPLPPQIDALKPGIVKLARLSQKHGVKLLYRNRAGAAGSVVFDLIDILKDCDPRAIGFLYDLGQGALAGGIDGWALGMRAAGPYIGAMSVSDAVLQLRHNTDEGGVFAGTPEQLATGRTTRNLVNYGGGGQANPWSGVSVPLGTGLADLPRTAQILKDIGFHGPLQIAADYPNGGAESGAATLTLPRALVLGAMKRDLLILKQIFGPAGLT